VRCLVFLLGFGREWAPWSFFYSISHSQPGPEHGIYSLLSIRSGSLSGFRPNFLPDPVLISSVVRPRAERLRGASMGGRETAAGSFAKSGCRVARSSTRSISRPFRVGRIGLLCPLLCLFQGARKGSRRVVCRLEPGQRRFVISHRSHRSYRI